MRSTRMPRVSPSVPPSLLSPSTPPPLLLISSSFISDTRMDWWHKLRRTWSLVPPLLKLGKSVGGSCGCNGGGGLMKLRDEVEMCGYRDVEVMWKMLSIKQTEKMEGRRRMREKVKVLKMK